MKDKTIIFLAILVIAAITGGIVYAVTRQNCPTCPDSDEVTCPACPPCPCYPITTMENFFSKIDTTLLTSVDGGCTDLKVKACN